MELSQPNKYPPGATLQCACGKQGLVASITGHWGKSKNPICRTIDRLYVVGVDNIPDPPPRTPEPPIQYPAEMAAAAYSNFDPSEALDTNGASSTDQETVNEEEMPVAGMQFETVGPRPKASSNGKAKAAPSNRVPRDRQMEWRQPPSTDRGEYEPGLVRTGVELPIRTYAYYEAARMDPRLAFQGSLSEFVDMTIDAFFQAIGAKGIRLVWDTTVEVV